MKYFVLDTSILDTRGAQSAPTPAPEAHLVAPWCDSARGRGSERDSSGTTEARNSPQVREAHAVEAMKREGDGADSPTRAKHEVRSEAARPNPFTILALS